MIHHGNLIVLPLNNLQGGILREQLRGLGLGVLFVGGLLYGQAAMACTTQAGTRENQKKYSATY